ncbi:MAG TPA: LamG-like jellyroll fold domain-containing protein, partial [Gillisia sp.]|nr:LamG-like jellyroll fold domain-containing protein [Gillisia sp.]
GDIVKIEGIFLTFQNNKTRECGATQGGGNQPKCYSTNNEATVSSPLFAVAFPNALLCNGGINGIINARASGGTRNYTFRLISSVNNSTIRPAQPSNSFTELPAGKYKVVVSDGTDTFTTNELEIVQPSDPLSLTLTSKTDVTCFGGNEGQATVMASGGTPNSSGDPYIYVWSNGQTSPTATNLTAGDSTIRVIDANGCEETITVTIDQPEQLLAVAGPDQVLVCGKTSTTLQADFNYEFTEGEEELFGKWTIVNGPAGGNFDDDTNPVTVFTGNQGTYTLRWSVPCGASDDVKISFINCNTNDFDGIDDHRVFGANFNLSGDFTIEAWVKQDPGKTAGIKTIFSKRDASNLAAGFDLIIENNIPKFRWNNSTLISLYPIGTDRWYHIAVIKGGTNAGLYVDGILVGESAPGTPTSLTQPFIIGAMYDSATQFTPVNYFHGWIEEVRIWNTALTLEQQHFMMNQKLENRNGKVRGLEIPIDVPGNLEWTSLIGYYQLEFSENGLTPGKITGNPAGKLINITTNQQRTAPLPYISTRAGQWHADATWLRPNVWDPPNSKGVDQITTIDWNIARISHNISSGGKDIKLLGLISNSEKLTIANSGETLNEYNSGQSLTITHYLKLNGIIDLVGESQLIQTDSSTPGQTIISVLDESSTGYLERDQQGTANSYNYNYWSSPVSMQGAANNSSYTVAGVKKDGTNSNTTNHPNLNFGAWHEFADGAFSSPRKVSNYWLHKFRGTANVYSEWKHIGSTGTLNAGEGYTMKGTSGKAKIEDSQNYVFKGKPNNGTIPLNIQQNQNYLLGNPYPSAIDIDKFILDNLNSADVAGGTNSKNVFNGAVYFWDHFAGGDTHILLEYIGGYATRNLIDGVPAISNDFRIKANDAKGNKIPGQYMPVAQGFFINSVIDPEMAGNISVDGGDIIFKNSQRAFMRENPETSIFLKPEVQTKQSQKTDIRAKIR